MSSNEVNDKKNEYSLVDFLIFLSGLTSFLLNLYLFVPVFVKRLGVKFTLKEQIYMSLENKSVSIPPAQWFMIILALGLAITSISLYKHCKKNEASKVGTKFAINALIMGVIFIVLAAVSLSIIPLWAFALLTSTIIFGWLFWVVTF